METSEKFQGREEKPEVADERSQLEQLEIAANAARIAGVYDHSDEER